MMAHIRLPLACILACLLGRLPAQAQVTRISNRAALHADVTVDWHRFGTDGAFVSTPTSRLFGAQRVGLGSSSGGLVLRREATTWHGDFTPGQFVMTQPNQSDNFIISFSPPVAGFGTQIDPGSGGSDSPPYTGRFRARLCLFGAHGAFLGLVQAASNADAAETGSARFLGAHVAGEPISYATVLVSGVTPGFTVEGDLAVNTLSVATAQTGAASVTTSPPTPAPAACR